MPPRWVRALLAVDRVAHAALRAETALRDEVLCALLDDATRDAMTEAIYAREDAWRAGARVDREGLHAWERELLDGPDFPRAGAVLVAGCGAGREIAALRARGHRVTGFDPCATLLDDARRRFAEDPAVRCQPGRIEDLATLRDAHFDAVLFGWSSLSYVPTHRARVEALRQVRRAWPAAVVIVSAWGTRTLTAPRVRSALRRILGAMGRRSPGGMTFRPWAGFVVALSADDLRRTATEAGYRVLREGLGLTADPWVLLRAVDAVTPTPARGSGEGHDT